MNSLRWLFVALAACAAASIPVSVSAQPYPNRPIKLVVPLTAGGPGDVVARAIAQKMGEALNQTVVVENKGGANMNIGAEYVARAAPDGYTLLVSATPMFVNPALYSHMSYDPVKDFAPISLIASFPLVLIANSSLPFKTVGELIVYAKARPGELNYGSAGNGSLTHLAGELFNEMSGTKLVHIPYRGINEAATDLIGGRVQLAFAGAPLGLSHAKQGNVRALASTSIRRAVGAPDLPTIDESGLAGFDVTPWYGIAAPAGTPPAIIARWQSELAKIMRSDDIKARWLALGADPVVSASPEEFAQLGRQEVAKWSKVVKDSNIKLN